MLIFLHEQKQRKSRKKPSSLPSNDSNAQDHTSKSGSSELDREGEHHAQTMLQIVASQFVEHRLAVSGLIIISCFVLTAVCAPWIGFMLNVDAESQNVFQRYKPMMSQVVVSSSDQESALENLLERLPEPVTTELNTAAAKALQLEDADDLEEALFILNEEPLAERKALVQAMPTDLEGRSPLLDLYTSFAKTHILGTDELGRDVLMRLIYGARVSMGVGILVALASALIGLIIGCCAGYFGGWVDTLLSRLTDSMLSLPLLPLLIIFAATDLQKIPMLGALIAGEHESLYKLVIIVCMFSWMPVARLVRGSTLSLKEQEFIMAARTLGATHVSILIKHVAPNVVAPLLVAVTLGVGETILWEAALSFLGLGIQPPTPSWGNMLFNAQELIHAAPMLAVLPGLLIFLTVISFNFLGDGIQDALDPKAIRR